MGVRRDELEGPWWFCIRRPATAAPLSPRELAWLAQAPAPWRIVSAASGAFAAPRPVDAAIRRALDAMTLAPAEPWTVERLARLAGLSRAAFARRFERAVGAPPKQHLATLRLELAAHRLETTDEALAAIAASVGYASEFAFSRAFKRRFGVAPGGFRRRAPARATMLRAA